VIDNVCILIFNAAGISLLQKYDEPHIVDCCIFSVPCCPIYLNKAAFELFLLEEKQVEYPAPLLTLLTGTKSIAMLAFNPLGCF
jgi:hypothetical protein